MIARRVLRRAVPAPLKAAVHKHRSGVLWSIHARGSFSQEGEDLLLERLTEQQPTGFYVDVGAHHPERFSNTRLLHRRGWSGINIDAAPGSMRAFERQRPRDVNLEVAVAKGHGTVDVMTFAEPALNTVDAEVARQRRAEGWELVGTRVVPSAPLGEILSKHVPPGVSIDVMSVDIEGADLAALESNDWDRFRPAILLVEQRGCSIADLLEQPVTKFLRGVGYEPVSKLVQTVVYQPLAGEPGEKPTPP